MEFASPMSFVAVPDSFLRGRFAHLILNYSALRATFNFLVSIARELQIGAVLGLTKMLVLLMNLKPTQAEH